MNKFQKELIKYNKLVAVRSRLRPSIYKFLVDKGVDYKIADEAQEFVSDAWQETSHKFDRILNNQVDVINRRLSESLSELKDQLQDIEDMINGIRFEV